MKTISYQDGIGLSFFPEIAEHLIDGTGIQFACAINRYKYDNDYDDSDDIYGRPNEWYEVHLHEYAQYVRGWIERILAFVKEKYPEKAKHLNFQYEYSSSLRASGNLVRIHVPPHTNALASIMLDAEY